MFRIFNAFAKPDRGRLCAKPKCRNPSQASVKGSSRRGGNQGSVYCSAHACQSIDPNLELWCTNYTKKGNRYCKYHQNCVFAKCHGSKKNGDKDMPMCSRHGCQSGDCKDAHTIDPSGKINYRFCPKHTCEQTGCGGEAKSSRWCTEHTCADPLCQGFVQVPNPANIGRQDPYCEVHRPCLLDNCNNLVYKVNNMVWIRYCHEHFCNFGNNCQEQRNQQPGAQACQKHTCQLVGCAGTLGTADAVFCRDHECTKKPPCKTMRRQHTEFCEVHLCKEWIHDCKSEGVPAKNGYCADHEACEEKGCQNFRWKENGILRHKCDDHMKAPCKYLEGCGNRAEPESRFCKTHICKANRECLDGKVMMSPFCKAHKCSEASCWEPRELTSNPPIYYDSSLNGFGYLQYCAKHCCYAARCNARAEGLGKFCQRHTCKNKKCDREAMEGRFCFRHSKDSREMAGGGWGGWGDGPYGMSDSDDEGMMNLRW